ncbi:hypothetical protein [Streptomyces sp. NPDC001948]
MLTTSRPESAAAEIEKALKAADLTPQYRETGSSHGAFVLRKDGLPGELWISDRKGHLHYEVADHQGLWARHYAHPGDGSARHTIYISSIPNLARDCSALIASLAAFRLPASSHLAAQISELRERLVYIEDQIACTQHPESAVDAATRIRRKIQRVTEAIAIDDARPNNQ